MSGELAELNELLIEQGLSQGESAVVGGSLGAIMGIFAGAAMIICVVALVIGLLKLIAYWRIFKKGGQPGWHAIIPILNSYTFTKVAGSNNFARIVISFLGYIIAYSVYGALAMGSTGAMVAVVIALIFAIWYLVESIIRFNALSKNFGKGTGFTVGLVLLNTIFLLILGFGGSQYNKVN